MNESRELFENLAMIIKAVLYLFEAPAPDPNAPKPEGSTMSPFPGEPLVVRAWYNL